MIEIKFDKIFVLDDGKYLIGYQEYHNFEQPDRSIKPEKVDAIMLISAENDRIQTSDPDGIERDYWLNKIGVLSDDDFQASAKKLQNKKKRQALYELLDKEFRKPEASG
ncbi:hypothetical protein ES707_07814 [subsurface metagenome]